MNNRQSKKLTPEETAFAAEHYKLIYTYLNKRHLPEDEFFDVVVFGYLNGVKKHFRREDLKQYSFSNLAWKAMDSCFSNYMRSEKRKEQISYPLNLHTRGKDGHTLEEKISTTRDFAEEIISSITLQETLNSLERTEREITQLLMDGWTEAEISENLGFTLPEIYEKIFHIQDKIKKNVLQAA